MTVSSTTTKNSYSGNGSTTVFAYGFKVFDEDDLTVILRTDATGTETVQTKTTHYTVSGVGSASGGNVTFGTAPASGVTVVIRRASPLTQTTDYTPNDPFPAASHEDALDNLTFIAQQQQEEIDRAIKLSRTNTMTSTEFTVGATDRANKVLAFDSSGEISVTQEIGTFQGNWAASTAYAERDLVKDTSTNNIFIVNSAHTSSGSQPLTTNTNSSKYDLIVDAASATTSASAAATSATAAASSATAAAASETAAATSETNAATSATNAGTSETNAANSATSAASSATTATTKASEASTSASNAATSATSAATSATAAATSATAAAASQTAAATSATNAATSATTATTQASTATTKASEAATSATNAATSATSASTAQTAAETAQTAAEAAKTAAELAADNFDDTYLGAKSSDPTVDNDGDALTAGDLYFNTTSDQLKYYTGSAWVAIAPGIANVSEDTSPQLGGNLDLNSNDITGTGNISTTGSATFTTADNDAQLTLISTDSDENTGPMLLLDRNSSSPANSDILSRIKTTGRNNAGQSFTASLFQTKINDVTDGGEDAEFKIETMTAGSVVNRLHITPSELVINDGSIDSDFRVESDGNANMLFVDAGNDRVGIGTASPAKPLTVVGGDFSTVLLDNSNSSHGTQILFQANGATNSGADIQMSDAGGMKIRTLAVEPLSFHTSASAGSPSEHMRIDTSGNVLVGKTASGIANNGIELRANDDVLITKDGATALYLNRKSSDGEIIEFRKDGTGVGVIGTQNWGIGTASPTSSSGGKLLAIETTANEHTNLVFNTANTGRNGIIEGRRTGRSGSERFAQINIQNDSDNGEIRFYTAGSGSDVSERARLDSSGRFAVGKVPDANFNIGVEFNPAGYLIASNANDKAGYFNRNTDGELLSIHRSSAQVGSVSVTTSGTTYNTTSDIRLKQDIEPLVATDKLMAMNPVSYAWKADPDGPRSMGFIAQEMQEVMPEAVSTGDDEDAMMSMDYGRITPILVSALQDAHRKIEQLEQRLADMEAK